MSSVPNIPHIPNRKRYKDRYNASAAPDHGAATVGADGSAPDSPRLLYLGSRSSRTSAGNAHHCHSMALPVYPLALPGHTFVRYDDGAMRFDIEPAYEGRAVDPWHTTRSSIAGHTGGISLT